MTDNNEDLTTAYMLGKYDGRKETQAANSRCSSASAGSRIAGLRDGLRKIVECEQGDVSNGQAIVLMSEIARLTLRADDIRSENDQMNRAKGVDSI